MREMNAEYVWEALLDYRDVIGDKPIDTIDARQDSRRLLDLCEIIYGNESYYSLETLYGTDIARRLRYMEVK